MRTRPPSVLLAEDAESLLVLYRFWLEQEGFEVVSAADGAQALAAVGRFGLPDVALVDVEMPVLGGIDLCRRLLRIDSELPVVFLTALDEVPAAARTAGAREVLRKPCAGEDLIRALREALSAARSPLPA